MKRPISSNPAEGMIGRRDKKKREERLSGYRSLKSVLPPEERRLDCAIHERAPGPDQSPRARQGDCRLNDVLAKDVRAPSLIVSVAGPAGQFSAAAVLARRAATMLETLSHHPGEELAQATNAIIEDLGGLFSDGCFDLRLRQGG